MSKEKGLILVNTGNGKGKSTAGFGTAFRALGYGYKVCIIQFIKGQWKTGEQEVFKQFDNLTHIITGDGFTWEHEDPSNDIRLANEGWERAKEIILNEEDETKLLVLDEFNIVMHLKFVGVEEVVEVLKNRRYNLDIILTGRDAPNEIIELAHTVTEMVPIKHAMDMGIPAKKGVEY